MSAGVRSMRVASPPPELPRSAPGIGLGSRLGLMLLVGVLFMALPGIVLASRSWSIGLTPATITEDTDTAIQVTATNTGGASGSDEIGCVEIVIPLAAEVKGLVINDASGRNWTASYTKGPLDTLVRLEAVDGGERLSGDPAYQSVTATLTVYVDLPGNYLWVANAFNQQSCSDSFFQPQILTLSVAPGAPNTAPVGTDDAYLATEDTLLAIPAPGVLVNDIDADGDPLTAVLAAGPAKAASFALAPDGSFSYQPLADWWGTDAFSYQASDGVTLSAPVTVSIAVAAAPDAPIAVDDAYALDEDTTLAEPLPGLLANDTDADGDPLTAVLVSGAPASAAAFTLAADGSFSFQPLPDFNGVDIFSYQVTDGALTSAVATATLTVVPVNDAPVAADHALTVDEDAELIVPAPGVLDNDLDVDADPLTAVLATEPAHGEVALAPDGSLSYRSEPDFFGTDVFAYVASDAVVTSEPATVTVSVAPVNDPPLAVDDVGSTSGDAVKVRVLDNDLDVDGPQLQVADYTQPAHGSVSQAGDRLRYVPDPGFAGVDTFRYVVTDGSAFDVGTVTITADPPTTTPSEPALQPPPPSEPDAPAPDASAAAPDAPPTPRDARPPAVPIGQGVPAAPDPASAVAEPAAAPLVVPTNDESAAPLMADLAFTRLALDWFIPILAFGVPGMLVALAVAAQLVGAAAWLPAVRGSLGSFGLRRRRRSAVA